MLLEDEASFYRQPTAASAWSPEGAIQPRMACSCRSNTPIRVAVAFDPVQGLLLHRLRPQFSAVEMGRFYQHLSISLPWARRIFLVMDNWPVHGHQAAWRAIRADERLQVLWLPTYAPWLNPAEKIWKLIRQKLTHMHPYADDKKSLSMNIERLLNLSAGDPQVLLKYTGTGKSKLYCS